MMAHPNGDTVDFITVLWKGTIMAMIIAVPSLAVFLGIYFGTGNIVAGAIVGFVIHFVIFAFSGRISRRLLAPGEGSRVI